MTTVKIIKFDPSKCDGDLACEKACSNVHHKNENGGEWSAIRIIKGDTGLVMENCNHCGLCIDMCPVQAIRRLGSGTVVINKKLCIGCQACVGFCSSEVMRKAPAVITPFKCISCGKCVSACPNGALELVEVDLEEVEETVYHKQGVC